jgi:hypothetical protein
MRELASPAVGVKRGDLWRHAVRAAIVVAVLLVGVGGLWAIARDAPSSAVGDTARVQTASITLSGGCQNFAQYWLDETSVPVDAATLELFTNCRMADDGRWYVWNELPDEAVDRPSILAERSAEAEATRERILEDIESFQASLSDSMMEGLGRIYSEQDNPVIGQTREGASVSSIRTRYARMMNGFLLDPERSALTGYVSWIMQTRIDAYGVFRRACLDDNTAWLRTPCTGMEDNLSIRYVPWYWELESDRWLDDYLAHLYAEPAEEAEA